MKTSFKGLLAGLLVGVAFPAFADNETIAVFRLNQVDEHFEAAKVGADKKATDMNARAQHYVPTKPNNLAEAMSQLEDVLVAKPSAVLFMPLNPDSQLPLIKTIIDSGIPVVNFNDKAGEAPFVSYVGQDDVSLGYEVAKALFEKLGGTGNVVIIEGIKGNSTSDNRVSGFNKAVAEYPNIKVLASQPANYSRLEALQLMENLIQQHDKIDGVIAASDNMSVAAAEALEAAGRSGVQIVGIDGTTEAAQALQEGRLLAVAEFSGFKMACIAMEVALKSLRGEQVPAEIILPGAMITKDNAAEWLVPAADRNCPSLADYPVSN